MDRFRSYGFFLLLLLLAAASCTIRNTTVAGEQLTIRDTDWMLLSFGDAAIPTAQNTQTSYIHFEEGSDRVRGFAGCNSFWGRYQAQGNRLNMSSISSTRMTCPDMEVERYLLGILDDVTDFQLSEDILILYIGEVAAATFKAGTSPPIGNEPLDEEQ